MQAPWVILSDLDGTLIDSRASVIAAFRWWAGERSLDPDWVEQTIPFGRTSTDAARVLDPGADAEQDGVLLDRRQEAEVAGVIALPGARALLDQDRWPVAIVTSSPRPLALARLEAAGLQVPDVLVTPEMWKRGKPDPEPYLRGAAAMGAQVGQCLVLEDAPAGVQAGLAAGTRVIGVLSTMRAQDLSGAHAYVGDVGEVAAVLDAWG